MKSSRAQGFFCIFHLGTEKKRPADEDIQQTWTRKKLKFSAEAKEQKAKKGTENF